MANLLELLALFFIVYGLAGACMWVVEPASESYMFRTYLVAWPYLLVKTIVKDLKQ